MQCMSLGCGSRLRHLSALPASIGSKCCIATCGLQIGAPPLTLQGKYVSSNLYDPYTLCGILLFCLFVFPLSHSVDGVCILWHGIVLLLSTWYNVAACVVVLLPQSLYLSRMKNQRGQWVYWICLLYTSPSPRDRG